MAAQTADDEQARKTAAELEKLPVIAEILARLRKELPPTLTFHNAAHADDVLIESVSFALKDKRAAREIELLAIAAAYHDSGFLKHSEDHEALGARMAQEAMMQHSYSPDEIELVRTMILDTKLLSIGTAMKRHATVPLSGYLLDADMSNFGRDDFFQRLDALCREQNAVLKDLYVQTLSLMQHHVWFTAAAKHDRQVKKNSNVTALQALVDHESNK